MKTVQQKLRRHPMPVFALSAMAVAVAYVGAASAAEIETGNPDLKVRADLTVRYNLGVRAEGINPAFANSAGNDETETKFDRGDVVTNRLDLIGEADVIYKDRHGVRMSASLWADGAYGTTSHPNTSSPFVGNNSNYAGGNYNSFADRYVRGPSGEILDLFAFTGFDLGDVSVSIKAGKHNVYWGESMFSIGNSIAYSQGPVDTIKAATSPGAEAKELFMPLNQISMQAQLAPTLSLAAQYLIDWKPFRLVPGGTYFASGASADAARADFGYAGPRPPLASYTIPNGTDVVPARKSGDFGLNLRWSPQAIDGTVGVYYRKFTEKLPWSITQLAGAAPTAIRMAFAQDTELLGLSYSTNVGSVSVGSELSYRKNTALVSQNGYNVQAPAGATYAQAEGARGDSFHALINGVYLLPKTALWESGTLSTELSYVQLDKVTSNPTNMFNPTGVFLGGKHASCTAATPLLGCVTKDAWSFNLSFTPEWGQVFPGWDLSLPVTLAYGLKGNSPTLGGTTEGTYNYSVGVGAKLKGRHEFSLKYADSYADYRTNAQGAYTEGKSASSVQNNHGWVFFTYKTTF